MFLHNCNKIQTPQRIEDWESLFDYIVRSERPCSIGAISESFKLPFFLIYKVQKRLTEEIMQGKIKGKNVHFGGVCLIRTLCEDSNLWFRRVVRTLVKGNTLLGGRLLRADTAFIDSVFFFLSLHTVLLLWSLQCYLKSIGY